jgi:hypothetical protein
MVRLGLKSSPSTFLILLFSSSLLDLITAPIIIFIWFLSMYRKSPGLLLFEIEEILDALMLFSLSKQLSIWDTLRVDAPNSLLFLYACFYNFEVFEFREYPKLLILLSLSLLIDSSWIFFSKLLMRWHFFSIIDSSIAIFSSCTNCLFSKSTRDL